ncbi:hypothetical protein KJW28_01275, partial [Pseudomonas syringae pv. aptata]|uniref:hypothetical protein n=1 Tax=Pseudomonas syringae TaxID=317 RepID=UPI001BDD8F9A
VKLVDTPASGAGDRKVVEVRVFFWAPIQKNRANGSVFSFLGSQSHLFQISRPHPAYIFNPKP